MADAKANPKVEKLRLEVKIGEQQLNVKRYDLRIAELEGEKAQLLVNREASLKEVERITAALKQFSSSEG